MKKLILVFVLLAGWGFCFGQVDLGNPDTLVGGGQLTPTPNEWHTNHDDQDDEPDTDPVEQVVAVEIINIDCEPNGDSNPKIFNATQTWKNVSGGWVLNQTTVLSYLAFRVSGQAWLSGIGGERAKISVKNIPANTNCYILEKTADLPTDTWINFDESTVGYCPETGKSAIYCEDVGSGEKMKVVVTIIAEAFDGFPSYLLECGNSTIEGQEINPTSEYFVILETIAKIDMATETFVGLPADTKIGLQRCCYVSANPLPDWSILGPSDIRNTAVTADSDDPNLWRDDSLTYGFIDFHYPQMLNPSLNIHADIPGRAGIYTYDDPSDASTYHQLISGTFEIGKPLQLPLRSEWGCKPTKLVFWHDKVAQGNVNISVSSMDVVPVLQPDPIPIPGGK